MVAQLAKASGKDRKKETSVFSSVDNIFSSRLFIFTVQTTRYLIYNLVCYIIVIERSYQRYYKSSTLFIAVILDFINNICLMRIFHFE